MPDIPSFPGKKTAEPKPIDPACLPEDISQLHDGTESILLTERRTWLAPVLRDMMAHTIKLAPQAFSSLLGDLRAHEALELHIRVDPDRAHPELLFNLRASGQTVQDTRQRSNALSMALDTAIDMAFPGFAIEAEDRNATFETAHSTRLVPQGIPLPLARRDNALDKPSVRIATENGQTAPQPDQIILPSLPRGIDGLPPIMRLLSRQEKRIELVISLRRQQLDAALLRRLYAARSTLQDKGAADFLEHATLPFREMGGNDFLTSILQDRQAYEIEAHIRSSQPLHDTLLSMICHALFGAPHDREEKPASLDLRPFHPHDIFHGKLLPVLFALVPIAAGERRADHLFPADGVLLGRTTDTALDVRQQDRDRARHTYIIGSTGTGKSTLIANMIKQDIENGKGVILFDPHGDLWQQIRKSVPRQRQKDLVLAHLGDAKFPFTMNILAGQGGKPAIEHNTMTNSLIELFKRVLYENVPEAFGPMFEVYFRNALLLLMNAQKDRATIMDFERIFEETRHYFDADGNIVSAEDEEEMQDNSSDPFAELSEILMEENNRRRPRRKTKFRHFLLERCDDERIKSFWNMAENVSYNEITISNIAPYIVCKLTQITGSPLLAPVLGARDSSLDFQKIMNEGKICLINLAKGEVGAKDAAFAGGLMSIRLAMAAQARARLPENERRPVNVYMDEFQTYATDMLSDMMSEVRKYGLRMILANQTLSQIDGSGHRADTSGGVLGNLIAFRVGIPDAEKLVNWFAPHITAEQLAQLPDYTAAARLLAKGRPLPPMFFTTLPPAGPGKTNSPAGNRC